MDIEKCRTCKHFDNFFHSCNLYYIESYLDEGDFDILTVDIKNVHETECKYEKTTRKRGVTLNYSKIIFEIEDDLKEKFLLYLVKNKSTQKEVLTEYIRKLVGTTTTSKGEN